MGSEMGNENDAPVLTAEEQDAIATMREKGLSPRQVLANAGAASQEPGDVLTRQQAAEMFDKRENQRLLRDAQANARVVQIKGLETHVEDRLNANQRLKEYPRRVVATRKGVMEKVLDSPQGQAAKDKSEFIAELDRITDLELEAELEELPDVTGSELDARLNAEREGGMPAGSHAEPGQGTRGPSRPATEYNDPAGERPRFGLDVTPMSQDDIERAFEDDVAAFSKEHGVTLNV